MRHVARQKQRNDGPSPTPTTTAKARPDSGTCILIAENDGADKASGVHEANDMQILLLNIQEPPATV